MTPEDAALALAALLPAEAVRRGWNLRGPARVANDKWAVNVIGPSAIEATEHYYGGSDPKRGVSHRWIPGVVGMIQAYDLEELVNQVALMLEAVVGPPDA